MQTIRRVKNTIITILWKTVSSYPYFVIGTGIFLAVASAACAFFFLQLNSNQDSLVSSSLPYHERYLEHIRNFGDQEYLYVVIKTGGTEKGQKTAAQFAETLNSRLSVHPELISAVYYCVSETDIGDHALFFTSLNEAEKLSATIISLAPYIQRWLRDATLAGFFDLISELFTQGGENFQDMDPAMMEKGLGTLGGLLKNMDGILQKDSRYRPLEEFSQSTKRYFFTSNGKLLIMRLLPVKNYGTMDVIRKPLQMVRQAIRDTKAEFPSVAAGLTGRPVLQADEMETTNSDMTMAAIVAIVLVGLLFMVILHGWLRPFLVLLCLLIAMAWSFGFATVTVGSLNLLSIVFALVLVGIGVDFGIHVVIRYVEASKGGGGPEDAVETSMFRTGPGIILGAITSVCAFYSVLGSDFVGLSELGLIGGTGVLFCLISMMTILPAMLLIAGKKKLFPSSTPRVTAMPFLEPLLRKPMRLILILAAISLAGLPGLFRVKFSYNLLELQAQGLESVEYEKILMDSSGESTWYAILTANSLDDVKRLTQNVQALPTVDKVESILDFFPEQQAVKSKLYQKAAAALGSVTENGVITGTPDADRLIKALTRLSSALETLEEQLFASGATKELSRIDQILKNIRSAQNLLQGEKEKVALLEGMQKGLLQDLSNSINKLIKWLKAGKMTPEDLPPSLKNLHIGKDGRYQIKVIPKEDVWDFDKLGRFVSELRTVDPEVSGVPVGVLESARLMHRTFLSAAVLTIALVTIILWLYSRSFGYIFLTMLPLGVSILWLLEIMGWFNLHFNLANFFAIPILIAIGVDGGVHLLARWRELQNPLNYHPKEKPGGLFNTSTPTAVVLSFATTMIGFGGLLFAHHRGMAGLGTVMVIGSFTGMLASILVLPPVLKLLKNLKNNG